MHLEKLFGSTGVYSPQGPEMVLECSGLMIARGVIIVAFLENALIGYSLESVCVFVCVCFCTITQKEIDLGTRNRNTL